MPGHYGAPKGGGAGKKPSLGSKYKPLAGKPGKGKMKESAKKPGITKPVRPMKRGK